jgi:thioredoxin
MKSLRIVIGRFFTVVSIGALLALATAGEMAYEKADFDAALAAPGGFVLALVTDWCTTCSRQEAAVAELLQESRFKRLTLFVADFDREVELRRRFRVVVQGTFVVFKDGDEVTRSTGVTEKAAIAALFAKAL